MAVKITAAALKMKLDLQKLLTVQQIKILGSTSYSYDEKGRMIKMISDTYHYEYKYDIAEASYTEEQYNEEEVISYIINYFDEHDNPLKTYYRNNEISGLYI